MRSAPSITRVILLLTLLLASSTTSAQAQSATALSRIGYTTVGMFVGAGVGAMAGTDCTGFVCIPPAVVVGVLGGGVGGLIAGSRVSSSARRALAAGRPLTSGEMSALTIGSTVGGATLGALLSSFLIRGEAEDTFLGSDEQTFGLFALAGAGLGIYRAIAFQRSIVPEGMQIRPDVMRDGKPGITLTLRF